MANTNEGTSSQTRKRYKTFLDPNYKEHWVSPRINSSWTAKAMEANFVPPVDDSIAELAQDTPECIDDNASRHGPHPGYSFNVPCAETDASNEARDCISMEEDSFAESLFGDEGSTDEENDDSGANERNHNVNEGDIGDNQNDDNYIMFEASDISIKDVMQMIIAYCVRFCLPHEAREELVEMIRCLAGPRYENWTMSKYKIKQQYDPPSDAISYTFFCSSCKVPVLGPVTKYEFQNQSVTCEGCQVSRQLTMKSADRFVYINLEYQLKELLTNQAIYQSLMDNLKVRDAALDEAEPIVIRDVYDGELYKAAVKKYARNNNNIILTYNFKTDGMPIFNSSKRSSWPLLLILNELPPHLRFKHIILCGLWVGDKEPTSSMMNTFLQQFVLQANYLTERGITVNNCKADESTFQLVPLCCIVDSVARPIVQNRLQYNGYHGCSWCYAHGNYVRGAVRYFFDEVDADPRTHDSHKNDVAIAAELKKPVNGVKGNSILLQLLLFDMVWGFPFEYMHAILLGVIKLLWDIWTSSGSAVYLTPMQRKEINRRIMQMTPIHEIKRLPRPLSEKSKWKATEWLSWLLFYSLPCLDGVIVDAALNNLSLLVESTFVLLQENISVEELNKCEVNLLRFVAEFEILYGQKFVTFNVHSLLHVVKSVKMSGPLWASSAFSFESTNYHLKKQVNGPKGVDDQISSRYLQKNIVNWKLGENPGYSEVVKRYCEKLFTRPDCTNHTKTTDNAVLVGKGRADDNVGVAYDRCIFRGTLFHTAGYKPDKRTNDSIVRLTTNEIVQLIDFINIDGQCYVNVRDLSIHGVFHVPHILKIRHYTNTVRRISISDIKEKLMILKVDETTYISRSPRIVD